MGARRGVLTLAGLATILACSVSPAAGNVAATTFVAHRHSLFVRIVVHGHRVVATKTGSTVHCEDGGRKFGSVSLTGWNDRVRIGRRGGFAKHKHESFEGLWDYAWRLDGEVRRDRIVGTFAAREWRLNNDESRSHCGTRAARGLPMRFIAHRVSGPSWPR